MQRQRMVLQDRATQLWAIIDQSALDDGLGNPAIMGEQVQFLRQATQ
jgi:hypothetical protein